MTGGKPAYRTGEKGHYYIAYNDTELVGYIYSEGINSTLNKAILLNKERGFKITKIKDPLRKQVRLI